MKNNQKGFSVVEGLLLLVIVGIIGFVGWYVWSAKDKTNKSLDAANSSSNQGSVSKTPAKQVDTTHPYSNGFDKLGISMDILPGWEVKSEPTTSGGSNFYKWTVQKSGADGKIVLSSTGFMGGFESCSPTKATIKEVVPTKNDDLLFMSWSYTTDDGTTSNVGIVNSDNSEFSTLAGSELTNPIKNKDTKPGDYYFCLGMPHPGFSLNLNHEPSPGFARKDGIGALSGTSTDSKYVPLSPTAQSYADIKAMLISIK